MLPICTAFWNDWLLCNVRDWSKYLTVIFPFLKRTYSTSKHMVTFSVRCLFDIWIVIIKCKAQLDPNVSLTGSKCVFNIFGIPSLTHNSVYKMRPNLCRGVLAFSAVSWPGSVSQGKLLVYSYILNAINASISETGLYLFSTEVFYPPVVDTADFCLRQLVLTVSF